MLLRKQTYNNSFQQFFKNGIIAFLLLVSINIFAQVESVIPSPPNPPRLVNDYSGKYLTHDQAQALEDKLVAYDDSSSNQIAVVIVDKLDGYSIADYATALGRKWEVGGQKQFSNGIVILVNTGIKGDRRGVFIATGYGLEGLVTDLVADQIIQNVLIPNFKAEQYYRGLDQATDEIMHAAAGRYTAPEGYHQTGGNGTGMLGFLLIILIVFIIIVIISRRGGGGGGYVSRRGYKDNWGGGWIIPGGGWSGGGNSGGGGWSGGGGGFGGFGGGSFGGGGAGGSW